MDDLSGLDWNTQSSGGQQINNVAQGKPFRPAPSPAISRTATPLSAQGSGNQIQGTVNAFSKKSTNGLSNGSFSNLLSPQPTKPAAPTSLQEKQKQLQNERDRARQGQDPYSGDDAKFWEGLGSGRDTPNTADGAKTETQQHDDLLAAFSASHPVDASSHLPAPRTSSRRPTSRTSGPPTSTQLTNGETSTRPGHHTNPSDDDPFGLGQTPSRPPAPSSSLAADEDDILGDLAKPVDETRRNQSPIRNKQSIAAQPAQRSPTSPHDKAVAELVEMGFSVEQAKDALAETETGTDVQVAVGFILNAAHKKSSAKTQSQSQSRSRPPRPEARHPDRARRRSGDEPHSTSAPPWMKTEEKKDREDLRSGQSSEEILQHATEFGASFMKSANTFWKASQKRVAKAVADFQPESDPNQPKWMRDASPAEAPASSRQAANWPQDTQTRVVENDRTTEAALLDASRPEPNRSKARRPSRPESSKGFPPTASHSTRPVDSDLPKQPTRNGVSSYEKPTTRPLGRVNRQMIEDETAQAYVSPARRKKQAPKPEPPSNPEPSLDIFSPEAASATASQNLAQPSKKPTATLNPRQGASGQSRVQHVSRTPPTVSPPALSTSHNQRQQGTAAFKRGDYPSAHSHYSAALAPLPDVHPITIVLKCNRALTALKTGDPRSAIADAEAALNVIGPLKGEGEAITLGDEGEKPMREFYGKALTRKAEAYEQMEKWSEATEAWRRVVESGLGGAIAIQGRNRCEKAAGTSQPNGTVAPVKKVAPPRPVKPRPRPSALADLNGTANGEAVKRLREKAAADAAASDEAFSLTDAVDARLTQWKGAKADNLRALLASLDTVLWPDSGWKKVGMGDIVLPNKVKIVYMKAIAKVHPDKISQTATTEQKMISSSVFATLNEAWDKFKSDNGM